MKKIKFKKSKIFHRRLFTVISIVALIGVFYWNKQYRLSSQPMVYKNDYLGIEFVLPSHVRQSNTSNYAPSFRNQLLPKDGSYGMRLIYSLTDVCREIARSNQVLLSRVIMINGIKTDYAEIKSPYRSSFKQVCLKQGDKFIYISAVQPDSYTSIQEEISNKDFQAILDSIKLTSPSLPVDISQWKYYSNRFFSLKYPPDWEIVDGTQKPNKSIIIRPPFFYYLEFGSPMVYISIIEKPEDLSLEKWLDMNNAPREREEFSIGKLKGIKTALMNAASAEDIVFLKDSKIIDFAIVGEKEDIGSQRSVFHEIRSTFKLAN